ncbi:scavenger receptor class B member 1 isoform X2 [Hyposmocoma kahamanoa]|uniref:scavenger receptor class B member 1 isoform X2 n=1 Tax=Hyposmocoma kahamanoa TaxID=1477025 RepID=UPI000E6DA0A8|nr:scavenger receptor class B member 1 isoform X2 [Hyposmocoma kahamanoa]
MLDALRANRKIRFVLASAVVMLLLGIVCAIFFGSWVRMVIDYKLVLRQGSMTFEWWARPPVRPFVRVYVYNVTNADEFLNNGSKPILDELGPYVYSEEWEKVNITDNENGTLSFQYKRMYTFQPHLSAGPDDDAVVVPNIPMLSATSQSKNAARFLRLAMASIMDILKIKPFVEVSVGQLLWGYDDPLLKLARDVVPKDQTLPYNEFGLFYGKNATSPDVVTMFTGVRDMAEYGIIERYNMRDKLPHWTTDQCNSIAGSDGSIFPPHITRNDTLSVYDKDLCRLLPLKYLTDVESSAGVEGYRFTPPENVFANDEHNRCFCPAGPPCAPNGLFNVSLCQYDSPIMLSFPHFYLADESLREAVEGISPPDPEKHRLFIDVQPEMGIAMRARARIQINLAVSQVVDIKQVANFPDIIFPILWFEEGIDELPSEVTSLLRLATRVPPIARAALGWGLSALGALLILLAVTCLIRSSHRQSTLRLEGHVIAKPPPPKTPSKENGYELNRR